MTSLRITWSAGFWSRYMVCHCVSEYLKICKGPNLLFLVCLLFFQSSSFSMKMLFMTVAPGITWQRCLALRPQLTSSCPHTCTIGSESWLLTMLTIASQASLPMCTKQILQVTHFFLVVRSVSLDWLTFASFIVIQYVSNIIDSLCRSLSAPDENPSEVKAMGTERNNLVISWKVTIHQV